MTRITPGYKKNKLDELFLESFNLSLAGLEKKYISDRKLSDKPLLFICGAPRSGTTFLTQVLARTGAFNYATNFVARFWRAPFVGLYLEQLMGLRDMEMDHSFQSNLGRTDSILDPHEFTYFWEYWLKPVGLTHVIPLSRLADIDVKGVNREVNAMLDFYDKPLFVKTHITMANPLILQKIFSNSYFVILRRNVLPNALSIFHARKKYFGDERHWWSVRPSNYHKLRKLPVEEQIIGQIQSIYADIEMQVKGFKERTLHIDYEQLCKKPRYVVDRITAFLSIKKVRRSVLKRRVPEKFTISDKKYSLATINRFKKKL